MLPVRYDFFSGSPSLFSLRRDIDRLFAEFMKDFTNLNESDTGEIGDVNAIAPRFDLVEKGGAYMLRADMPGVDAKDVKVQVTGNTLTIEGEHRDERSEGGDGDTERLHERVWRRYQRSLTLPETVDASKIEATLQNGVLTLTLPRTEQARPRQIEVRADGGSRQLEGAKGGAKQIGVSKQEKKKEAA
jgi:HSP20 family protein